MTPRVWGLGSGGSLHSSDTLASRIGSFWELGLWIPNGVCVLEAARALKSCPFSSTFKLGHKERGPHSGVGVCS